MARVGAHRERNAQPGPLGHFLQLVVLLGERRRRAAQASDAGTDPQVAHHDGVFRQVVLGPHPHTPHRAHAADRAVHHRPGLFGERHAPGQVPGPRVGGEPPVFVGIDASVAIEVAKPQAVLLQELGDARAEHRLGGGRCALFRCAAGAPPGDAIDTSAQREMAACTWAVRIRPCFMKASMLVVTEYGTVRCLMHAR